MTASINGTTGVTFPDASVQATAATGFGFKNRILNPAMMIDQRNAGASVTVTTGVSYTLDRWATGFTQLSKFTIQQNAGSVTPPVGFKNYLGITSSAATSVGSGDAFYIYQPIEGLNVSDFAWGTANAATVTLSFKVYSSLTGTFGGALQNNGSTRSYPFSYTISSANTWTSVAVTIPGDTTGTWLTTNGAGINLYFSIGTGATYSGTSGAWAGTNYVSVTGATSVVGTSGATFYITGVQLEKGSTATSFDYRPYGMELALCQRYFATSYGIGVAVGTITTVGAPTRYVDATNNYASLPVYFPVQMRANPTVTSYGVLAGGTSGQVSGDSVNKAGSVGLVGQLCFLMSANNVSTSATESVRGHYTASAEL